MKTSPKTSIKRKIVAVMMRASVAVLLVTVVAFMVYDLVTFRQAMVRNLITQARMIAENSSGSLAFQDETDATNVLASLRNDPHIVAAALYDKSGKLFAGYAPPAAPAIFPANPERPGYHFEKSSLIVFQPVEQRDAQLGTLFAGTLYLKSDLTALSQRLELYAAISVVIMFGSLLVAFWLSNTLQKRISNPIIALAETARRISEHQNYSLRATKQSEDELGLLTGAFNTMLDRIEASDLALRASEAQFRLVTDQAPVMLAHVDRQYRYKFVNQSYAGHYGRKPQEIVGKRAVEIVGPELFERARPYVDRALTGERMQFELEISTGGRPARWSHVVYTPERSPAGEVVGFVAVHTDITLRKQAEIEIERARDQALAASRAKDDFLAALSHELRTPLNPVLLLASDGAGNLQLPEETRAEFEMIRRNVELEARLIDDLLDLTRITRGKLALEMQPLDMLVVLREAMATIRTDAEEKNIAVVCEWPGEMLTILGDGVRLQQIFWNVLKNAVKFTPAGGRIMIRPRTIGGNAVVTISDTGIGMTPAEIGQVFNAFSQGEHAGLAGSHQFGGLGLGLAISRSLVELQSGTIQAESAGRHRGATFTINFPLATPNPDTKGASPAGAMADRMPTGLSRKEGLRILLVEDHEPTRIALTNLLTRRHYKVLAAASVAEAMALVSRESFDVVVSDIGLPDGDGYSLMSELRDHYGLNGIALTGYGMDQDINRAREAGFVSHLTKPVRVDALEQALTDAI